jgi:hypothetical protein
MILDRIERVGHGSKCEINSVAKSCFWSGPKHSGWVQNKLDGSKTIWTSPKSFWTYRRTKQRQIKSNMYMYIETNK